MFQIYRIACIQEQFIMHICNSAAISYKQLTLLMKKFLTVKKNLFALKICFIMKFNPDCILLFFLIQGVYTLQLSKIG